MTRRSTRSTRSTRASAPIPEAHRKVVSTRPEQSVRASANRLGSNRIKQPVGKTIDEPIQIKRKMSTRKPKEKPSRSVKREIKKYMAPIEFFAALIFIVFISIFAFGLLQGTAKPDGGNITNERDDHIIIFDERTSTNTGILRGRE